MGRKKPMVRGDSWNLPAASEGGVGAGSKLEKEALVVDDDEYVQDAITGKKKGTCGEAPPNANPTPMPLQEEKVSLHPETIVPAEAEGKKYGEERKEKSAAAKKRRKKKEKEKEKEKKAAAAAAAEKVEENKVESEPKQSDGKGKTADKKVPRHVMAMQEAIARRREMEEEKAREEEEKRRKEEEEGLRQEELERQAEQARHRKSEIFFEELLKNQEGMLLNGKQKEEQKQLEGWRTQILANSSRSIPTVDKDCAPPPQWRTNVEKEEENVEAKDKKAAQKCIAAEVESMEADQVEEVDTVKAKEKSEVVNGVEENGVEEDDEEVDSSPEPIMEKEEKPLSKEAAKPTVGAKELVKKEYHKFENVVSKHVQHDVEVPARTKGVVSEAPKQGVSLRSPICCVMGHVDTGKTKLLDYIRGTNVQESEAGGITQQIGATYIPVENIRERTKELKADATIKVPGLLIIDTPGHESFTKLRLRGSGVCDIAILVVDIMHGLEPQTKESLKLLKMGNTEFIVALNKVDRLYGWKTCPNAPIQKAMTQQTKDVQNEFKRRLIQIMTEFKEQGLNTELYYKNKDMGETFSIVPTSAISGEGIPDLLLLLVHWTQKTMAEKLTFSNEVQCTILEVKVIEGHGTTIDVVLANGVLHEGDQIVVRGLKGSVVTTIRALLMPHPMKELRVKGTYVHHKEIKAAQGIKITAQGLEHAVVGTGFYVVGPDDDLEVFKDVAMEDVNRIEKSGTGVYVQASTQGSLEALLEFLNTQNIPVSGIGIGPVHKKDVKKASVMLAKKKEYATILAFDVKVATDARQLAGELGVTIFIADIIYHLFDQFKAYIDNFRKKRMKELNYDAVFPCKLRILRKFVFKEKDPIFLRVEVLEGRAEIGTPICIKSDCIDIGRIVSIELDNSPVQRAYIEERVTIKIVNSDPEEQLKAYGRHLDIADELVSHISRKSINVLKDYSRRRLYWYQLGPEDWKLIVELKELFEIE